MTGLRVPVVTASVCGAALGVAALEPLRRLLIYERGAVESGELWRLVTGSLVHHAPSHLLWNLAALAVAGTLIELLGLGRRLAVLYLAAAAAVGFAVHFSAPALDVYAGLSGVAVAAVAFLCLDGLRDRGAWRWTCAAALAVLVAKLAVELGTGSSVFGDTATAGFVLAPVSHAAGALTALAFRWPWRSSEPAPAATPARRREAGTMKIGHGGSNFPI